MDKPLFLAGKDIAIKVPKYKYDETVRFYQYVLSLSVKEREENYTAFDFGEITLWIDCMDHYAQSDVWIELFTSDLNKASTHLHQHSVSRRDEVEEQLNGFWVSDPTGTIIRIGEDSSDG